MPSTDALPDWLSESRLRTIAPVRLAVFGRDLLAAVHRWPRVIQGMYASLADQLTRLRAQLVICQLPRVDERVLAMFWLLAQTWGQVTPSGVRLPLALTHETLGALIGARRPTVTLALRKLTEDGSLASSRNRADRLRRCSPRASASRRQRSGVERLHRHDRARGAAVGTAHRKHGHVALKRLAPPVRRGYDHLLAP
jgi:CRP/FNR family cyclic AMP-dependent transcriptional regulator